jgi:hypothetical protein
MVQDFYINLLAHCPFQSRLLKQAIKTFQYAHKYLSSLNTLFIAFRENSSGHFNFLIFLSSLISARAETVRVKWEEDFLWTALSVDVSTQRLSFH